MKKLKLFTTIFILFLTINFVSGQEQKPTANEPQNGVTKANHNTARSNKTTIAAPDRDTGGDTSSETDNSSIQTSKKGYDYYKSNSDLHRKRPGGTKDHNSSRSNKTSSVAAPDEGDGDLNKSDVDKKTNKSEAARAKRK